MERSGYLMIRIDEGLKEKIRAAATMNGESLTTFTTKALVHALRRNKRQQRNEKREPKKWRGVHYGVPRFMWALCMEARQGGRNTYRNVGYQLAIHLGEQRPADIQLKEWIEEVEDLNRLLGSDSYTADPEDAWDWFTSHFPRIMELVPSRRRAQFVAGVREARADGRLGLS